MIKTDWIKIAFGQVPSSDDEKTEKYWEKMSTYAAKNGFYDIDWSLERNRNTLNTEMTFFNSVKELLIKDYPVLSSVQFVPGHSMRFNIGTQQKDGIDYIYIDDLLPLFLSHICIALRYLMEVSIEEDLSQEETDEIKKFIIGIMDLNSEKKLYTGPNDLYYEVMTYKKETTMQAAYISRAIIIFLILHEMAHIILPNLSDSCENEHECDKLACSLFFGMIGKVIEFKDMEHISFISRAPLLLFDIFELLEFYRYEVYGIENNSGTHPKPFIRKGKLIESFAFSWDDGTSDLYLLIKDGIDEMKSYIYYKKDSIREVANSVVDCSINYI